MYDTPCLISTVQWGRRFRAWVIPRLSRQFNAVDNTKRASRLRIPGQRLQPFRKRRERHGLASPGWERDPDLCGAVLEHVQAEFKAHLLEWSQVQRAGMGVAQTQGPRCERSRRT